MLTHDVTHDGDPGMYRRMQAGSAKDTTGRLELVAADITQPATLLPEMFEGVSAVVNASAVKVAPKEGDTPDRAKYLQVG